jgi:hypothetical protein
VLADSPALAEDGVGGGAFCGRGGPLPMKRWLQPRGRSRSPNPRGWVSKIWPPSGSVTQGCLLRVHRCTVGRSHEVSSSVPPRTARVGEPGLGAALIREPQSGQSQRTRRAPLSAVRSTNQGSGPLGHGRDPNKAVYFAIATCAS